MKYISSYTINNKKNNVRSYKNKKNQICMFLYIDIFLRDLPHVSVL